MSTQYAKHSRYMNSPIVKSNFLTTLTIKPTIHKTFKTYFKRHMHATKKKGKT